MVVDLNVEVRAELYVPHLGWLEHMPGDDVAEFLNQSWFEYKEQAFLWLYLREGDTVIDCGAHIGLFSVLSALAMNDRGGILAIEPHPYTVKALRRNLEHRNIASVEVIEGAAYASPGKNVLYAGDSTKAAYSSLKIEGENSEKIEVDAFPLDWLLEQRNIRRVDFLKIDVEGAELEVLEGSQKSVSEGRLPLAMIEFTELNLQARGRSTNDLREACERLGYCLYRFDEEALQLVPATFDGPVWYENLFAALEVEAVNRRLKEATGAHKRIVRDVLARGQAAHRLVQEKDASRARAEDAERVADTLRRAEVERRVAVQRLGEILRSHVLRSYWTLRPWERPVWVPEAVRQWSVVDQNEWIDQGSLAANNRRENSDELSPKVSVILCTHNPRPDLLRWALESIAAQALEKAEYEVILVDNNSTTPIEGDEIGQGLQLPLRVIRENRQGLTFARIAGIREARGEIHVFVDDDNYLEPDYLANALAIANEEPDIGLYGGIAIGRLEAPVTGWKKGLLSHLGVRDYGSEPITSREERWGKWEPIGAGMVARRDVAKSFVGFVEDNTAAGGLGRNGNVLLSGEDSLFARTASRAGYACSYQPRLKLHHFIKRERLTGRYLFRLLKGHGHSYVRLERLMGKPVERQSRQAGLMFLSRRLVSRVVREGRSGLIKWGWDWGYVQESRNAE